MNIELRPLRESEREDFIKRNQAAFRKAAVEQFGETDKEIIPREDIISSLNAKTAHSFQIVCDGIVSGGAVVQINENTHRNSLDLLFVDVDSHSRGIGQAVWQMIEKRFPETLVWETHTPYFETRNIHFYVNKCGFHIVEFFNPKHPEPHPTDTPGGEFFFRFEKQMK